MVGVDYFQPFSSFTPALFFRSSLYSTSHVATCVSYFHIAHSSVRCCIARIRDLSRTSSFQDIVGFVGFGLCEKYYGILLIEYRSVLFKLEQFWQYVSGMIEKFQNIVVFSTV